MATFIGVVLTTVDMGLIICLAMTVFVMTYRNYQINIMEVEQAAFEEDEINDDKDSDDENGDKDDNDEEKADENILVLKIVGVLSFANYEKVLKQLNKRLKRQRQKTSHLEGGTPVSVSFIIRVSIKFLYFVINTYYVQILSGVTLLFRL